MEIGDMFGCFRSKSLLMTSSLHLILATFSEGLELAAAFAKGKEVISLTASSMLSLRGVLVVVFYYDGEVAPTEELHVVSASANAWESAAADIVLKINELKLERGQLLGIDAHNYDPDSPAMFGALYSRDLHGHGPLRLDWAALNQENPWSFFCEAGCKMSEGKDVLSITGSSNCDGRSVQYIFWQAALR